jgi:voltage-gated potassium channel
VERHRSYDGVMARSVTLRQVALAGGAFALLVVVGTIGFMALLGESTFDALYRTVITVYTAGLVEVPQSTGARAFTLFLVVWGVAVFFYAFALVIELAVGGTLGGAWQQRRARRAVGRMHNHFIICGYGRAGRRVAAEFREQGLEYVVLDHNPDALKAAQDRGDVFIEGDGTDTEALLEAGLAQARGLVASSDSDVANLYITLSGKARRPELYVVARASTEDAAEKLRLAGADRVVQPYATAGLEMAKLAAKPQVAAFLDIVTSAGGPDLSMEEIEVTAASGKAGQSIRSLRVRHATGALVIAVLRSDGTFEATPEPDAPLEEGDVLIAVGTILELQRLEELFSAPVSR